MLLKDLDAHEEGRKSMLINKCRKDTHRMRNKDTHRSLLNPLRQCASDVHFG